MAYSHSYILLYPQFTPVGPTEGDYHCSGPIINRQLDQTLC